MTRPPPTSTLFPYTTLFRSCAVPSERAGHERPREDPLAASAPSRPVGCDPSPGNGAVSRSGSAVTRLQHSRSEEHTSELQSQSNLVCRLLLEKKKTTVPTNR